jgi:hypothetical protein
MSTQTALFINKTDLPIMVEAFNQVGVDSGLNKLVSVLVMPNEECKIRSITGEWFLTTYFNDSKYKKMWADKNMRDICDIGKFRNDPCIQGEYSWLETDLFKVSYLDNVKTFSFSYF